jgi:hypothetical protein
MRQTVMTFASSSARDTALSGVLTEGMFAYLSDSDTVTVYSGSAWVTVTTLGTWASFTPTISQGASSDVAKTVDYSRYLRHGRMITWSFFMTLSASGTAGSAVEVTLPLAATSTQSIVGSGRVFDTSTSTSYSGTLLGSATTKVRLFGDWSGTGAWGSTPNLAIASGDVISGAITYESAA